MSKYLTFMIGDETFALNFNKIVRISPASGLKYTKKTEIPYIAVAEKKYPVIYGKEDCSKIIIVTVKHLKEIHFAPVELPLEVGFFVEKIKSIVEYDDLELRDKGQNDLVKATMILDKDILPIINISHLFSVEQKEIAYNFFQDEKKLKKEESKIMQSLNSRLEMFSEQRDIINLWKKKHPDQV